MGKRFKRVIEVEEVVIDEKVYFRAVGSEALFFTMAELFLVTLPYVERNDNKSNDNKSNEEREPSAKEEEFLNCKFRVLKSTPGGGLRAGNVYEVEDGRFMDSYGMIAPMFSPLKDKRNLERFLTGIDFEILEEE